MRGGRRCLRYRARLLGRISWRASFVDRRPHLALAPQQLALRRALLARGQADRVVRWDIIAVHRLHRHLDHTAVLFVVVLHGLTLLQHISAAAAGCSAAAGTARSPAAAASVLSEATATPPISWLLDPAPLARGLPPPSRLACMFARAAATAFSCFFNFSAAFPAFELDREACSVGPAAFRLRDWTSWAFPMLTGTLTGNANWKPPARRPSLVKCCN